MSKIPVGRTIGQAYGFAFGRYLPLLGVVWLPLLVMGALTFFIMMPFYQQLPDMIETIARNPHGGQPFPAEMSGILRWVGLLDIIVLLVFAMIAVGVTKEALGLRKGPRFVYLSLGADEFRVIGGYILIFALMIAAVIALEIVVVIVAIAGAAVFASGTSSHLDPKAAGSGVGVAVLLVVLLVTLVEFAFAYVYVRLSYLIVPVTVAEHRFGVWRSWELTKGNFWRIFVISLAVMVPVLIVEFLAFGLAFGSSLAGILSAMQKSPADGAHQMAQLMRGFVTMLPYTWVIGFIFSPIIYGLWMSPSAFAYRALVPAEPEGGATPMMAAHP
jgi:hypothetical protein